MLNITTQQAVAMIAELSATNWINDLRIRDLEQRCEALSKENNQLNHDLAMRDFDHTQRNGLAPTTAENSP